MASSADIRDIMGLSAGGRPQEVTKEMILGTDKPKKIYPKKSDTVMKRPEGMARELYNLLYNDNKDAPPLIPTGKLLFRLPKKILGYPKRNDSQIYLRLRDDALYFSQILMLIFLLFQIRPLVKTKVTNK